MLYIFLLLTFSSIGNSSELNLKNQLLENYRNDIKPTDTIDLKIGMALRALNNINQIDGTLEMNVWLRYWWKDTMLSWNSTKWGFKKLNFFTHQEYSIWTPDVYLYNTAELPLQELDNTMAMVYADGSVIWSRPGMLKSTCQFELENFPYDTQICSLKFGSWSYSKSELNLSLPDTNTLDISNFQPNQGWDLISWNAELEEKTYTCCPEVYQDLVINLKLKRDPSYYKLNIIIPTFATASLMIVSLLIPWDSGERISFAVTVMLSIIVFLLILSENLPKTKTKPLLSRMLIGLVFFSLFVVFFTIVVSYFRSTNIECCIPKIPEEEMRGVRSSSYREAMNDKKKKEECDKKASKIEKVFTLGFFIGFLIYTITIFNFS
jgi:nicotinic acetylcholine receptor, invertebrate